jgi:hypothetical protein
MSDSINLSWSEHTAVDREEVLDHMYQVESWEEGLLKVDSYCIKPSAGTLNKSGFVRLLKKQFPKFVFSESRQEEHEWPGLEAVDYIAEKEDEDVGIVGELILFTLVEASLEIPMVCHKVSLKQDPAQPVKGSDGLFYGEFRDKEALAFGEAKLKMQRSTAIKEALADTERFQGPDGQGERTFELQVASKTLSDDLSQSEVERIADALSPTPTDNREIHPVFIGYQDEKLGDFQKECDTREELMEKIANRVSKSDLKSYIRDKIATDYPELEKYWIIFFLFPIDDTTSFKKAWQDEIFHRGR